MHLTSSLALDLIEGQLPSGRIQSLTEHIDRCPRCSQQLKEWQHVHSKLGSPHLKSAPFGILEAARAIFDAESEVKRPIFREIAAAVVFDSLTQAAVAGARGPTGGRQMVLRAEELDIHLKISSNPSQHQIIGQVFVRNETEFLSNVRLHLVRDRKPFKSTWSDNFGAFQFSEVPEGVFHLQVDLPHLTVVGGISIDEYTPGTDQGS